MTDETKDPLREAVEGAIWRLSCAHDKIEGPGARAVGMALGELRAALSAVSAPPPARVVSREIAEDLHALAQPLVDHVEAGKLAKRVVDFLTPGAALAAPPPDPQGWEGLVDAYGLHRFNAGVSSGRRATARQRVDETLAEAARTTLLRALRASVSGARKGEHHE